MKRVVVTGMGVITGYGAGTGALWDGLSAGRSCVRRISLFDPEIYPVHIAAQVEDLPMDGFPESLRQKAITRSSQLAFVAAREAWLDAGLPMDSSAGSPRHGLAASVGWGAYDIQEVLRPILTLCSRKKDYALQPLFDEIQKHLKPGFVDRIRTGYGEELLAEAFGLKGPQLSCLSACAASTQAIGDGVRSIRLGEADVVLAGGADSRIHPLGLLGYHSLGVLVTGYDQRPTEASRPFSRDHAGFVMGEGGGFLILEEFEHAQRRGAKIRAEILGTASTCDAEHVTDPHESGVPASECMSICLRRAGLGAGEIDYINAHGTSTPANDIMETRAVKRVFGGCAKTIPMSSMKSMIGHLSLAAGAVEVVGSILTLEHQIVPPTINLDEPDPECDLDYVPNKARPLGMRTVLKNSFGFGGQNASIILRKG